MSLIRTVAAVAALTFAVTGTAIAQAAPRPPAPRMPHPAAGKADCLSCHGAGANAHITSVPAAHRFANSACAMCHRLAATMPPVSQHPMDAAHTTCATCHVAGSPTHAAPVPASHADRHASTCVLCHTAAAPPG